ncbi:MAG: glycosyltransferase family 9 protein [Collimonas sp.]|uniref:glycosyltransferase family 9 protein n=1 Tax=Collimonas sp. TaxID=1963772 RepID=UPI0032633799
MHSLHELTTSYAAYQQETNIRTALDLIDKLRFAGKADDAIDLASKWSDTAAAPISRAQLAYAMSCLGMLVPAERILQEVLPQFETDGETRYQLLLELAIVKYCMGKFHEAHLLQRTLHQPEWCEIWTRLVSPNHDNNWFLPHKDKVLYDQPVAGKTIMIAGEGGAGDLLLFSRYVKRLQQEGAALIYCHVPPALQSLMVNSGLPIVAVDDTFSQMAECDFVTWTFALFTRYQKSPYFPAAEESYLALSASHALADGLQEKLRRSGSGRRRIGLVWRSATQVRHEPYRSMDLQALVPLLESADADFFSLQVDILSEEEKVLMERHQIVDLAPHLASFEDSAHVLEQLDLLISVDSAPAHLAGARQRPVWLVLAGSCDYRWYDCQRFTPWYSSMRLYRQARLGDWQPVVAAMSADLSAQIPA